MRTVKHQISLGVLLVTACSSPAPTPVAARGPLVAAPVPSETTSSQVPVSSADQQRADSERTLGAGGLQVTSDAAECSRGDWSSQKLLPLLTRGKGGRSQLAGKRGAEEELFRGACTDAPDGAGTDGAVSTVVDGVQLTVLRNKPAGKSGRGWQGNHCEFELRLADGAGVPVVLGGDRVPPFNTVRALVRSGSAVWLNLGFNGYAREFPKGGNRVVAVDLCDGRVVWQSKDSVSNGGLLLLGDYLVTAYGFTGERRYVFVLDAHSGSVVQKLPVIENVCPSEAWAPNWQPGERCDAPGQAVGAATAPRVEDGVFLVDTNTGSSAFSFR